MSTAWALGKIGGAKARAALEKRRNSEFPIEMNIRREDNSKIVLISTEPGRVLRPLIVVSNGNSRLTNELMLELEQGNNQKRAGVIKVIKDKLIAIEKSVLKSLETVSDPTHISMTDQSLAIHEGQQNRYSVVELEEDARVVTFSTPAKPTV